MEIKKNQIYSAEIIDVTNEGFGVCKIQGYTVFVPMTAVGDFADIKITKANKNYGYGIADKIITPSDNRIQPDCEAYRLCGGCSFRHMTYAAELEIKQKIVDDAFGKIGRFAVKSEKIIGGERTFYRNKAQYPFGIDSSGMVTAGFFRRHSHDVVPCAKCMIQNQGFSGIVNSAVEFANSENISVYDEKTGNGALRNLYIRYSEMQDEYMVCIVAADMKKQTAESMAEYIILKNPKVATAVLNINRKKTNVILGDEYTLLFGKGYITEKLCGIKLDISPQSFFQVNRVQAEKLYNIAADMVNPEAKDNDLVLLDLYCGTGSIGLSMAGRVSKLIGAEIVPQAVEDAKGNAKKNGIDNAEFICADAGQAAQTLKGKLNPDIVVVDPPRKGCSRELLNAVCEMNVKKIIMISCNPATAARDCAILSESGYKLEKIKPVDLFPGTCHCECVVQLQKNDL